MAELNVIVFIDWYRPFFKAGGPVRSMVNMVDHLRDEVRFHIVTGDREYTATESQQELVKDEWQELDANERVWYASNGSLHIGSVTDLIRSVTDAVVYINGIYSLRFSIIPLLAAKRLDRRRIIAVRGMLAPGPMAHGAFKKRAFLALAKLIGLYRGAEFQATNAEEVQQIGRWVGKRCKVHLVPNLPRRSEVDAPARHVREQGRVKLVSMARIAMEKNTLVAIQSLRYVKAPVQLDLYGPIYDRSYWKTCQDVIRKLPAHVSVTHHGSIDAAQVPEAIAEHDALFMPSAGENFGHTMLEALIVGRPLIISDRTPWRDLEKQHAGWDIPLDQDAQKHFAACIDRLASSNHEEFERWCTGAFNLGARYLKDAGPRDASLAMLKG